MKQSMTALLLAAFLFPLGGLGSPAESFSAQAQELLTYENTSVGGTLDPGGEGERYYTVTAEPVKGSLCVMADGRFLYTPREGKLGRDSFYYRCSDCEGSLSREMCVQIRIESQSGGVHYEDMRGRAEAFAAARLSEAGLFTGEQLLGRYCFHPDKAVTRGEFLSICLQLSGKPILGAVQTTGCLDDEAIPVWMKSYVLSASLQGLAVERDDCFAPEEPITQAEASQMARELLALEWQTETPEAELLRGQMAELLLPALGEQ